MNGLLTEAARARVMAEGLPDRCCGCRKDRATSRELVEWGVRTE